MVNTNIPTYSIDDIIDAYNSCDASDETKEIISYFVSELTGISIDKLYEMSAEKQN